MIEVKSKANWYINKIAECEKELNENNLLHKQELERLKEWKERVDEKALASKEHFMALLRQHMEENNIKRLDLPNGRVGFRKQQVKWDYNEEQLKEKYQDFVEVQTKFKLREFKKNLIINNGKVINKETGEIVDNINIEEREEKLEVKLND